MQKLFKWNLQTKLLVSYILLIIAPLSMVLLSAYIVTDINIRSQMGDTIQQTLVQTSKNLSNELGRITEISNIVYANQYLQSVLSQKKDITYSEFERQALNLRNVFNNIIWSGQVIKINVFYSDTLHFHNWSSAEIQSESSFHQSELYKSISKNPSKIRWATVRESSGQDKTDYLVQVRDIESQVTNEHLGTMAVYYDINNISRSINNIRLGNTGFVFVIDEDGRVIAHHNASLILSNILDKNYVRRILSGDGSFFSKQNGIEYLFTVHTINETGWRIVAVVQKNELNRQLGYIAVLVIPISIVTILLAVLLSYFITRSISRRIKDMSDAVRQVESGNLDVKLEVKDEGDEISFLAHGFHSMLLRLKSLINDIHDTEERKRMADLRVLYEQINPHFIYNTLDSINWMASSKSPNNFEKISLMVNSLAQLLRIGLSKGRDIITLREELEHVKCYVNIQSLRCDNSFNVEYDVDENLLYLRVIKIFIQPLVENAIMHGFDDLDYPGLIKISAKRDNDTLMIKVSDNGKGCDVNKINDLIKRRTNDDKTNENAGFGLRNIQERIRLYYTVESGVELELNETGGVTVTVRLPVIN